MHAVLEANKWVLQGGLWQQICTGRMKWVSMQRVLEADWFHKEACGKWFAQTGWNGCPRMRSWKQADGFYKDCSNRFAQAGWNGCPCIRSWKQADWFHKAYCGKWFAQTGWNGCPWRGSWKQVAFTRIVVGGFHRLDEMGVHAEGLGSRLVLQGGL